MNAEMKAKLQVGKVVRVSWTGRDGKKSEVVGGVRSLAYHVEILSTAGETIQIVSEQINKVTFTKLEPNVRNAYQAFFQQEAEIEALDKKRREIVSKIQQKYSTLTQQMVAVAKAAGSLSAQDIEKVFGESGRVYVQRLGGELILQIDLVNYIEKYVRVGSYDFIDNEYDNTLYISDEKAAIKEVGINIPDSLMNPLKKAILQVKGLKLEQVLDSVDIGDKNWLVANKTLMLKISEKAIPATFLSDLAPISRAVQSIINRLHLQG